MRTVLQKVLGTAVAVGVVYTGSASANDGDSVKKQMVGVWRLVTDVNVDKDGKKTTGLGFGANPKGTFIFTASGHYAVVNSRADLPKFASGNRMQGTAEEYKAIGQGSIAHYGRWSVTPDGKAFVLKVEGSTWPAWVGAEQKRQVTIKGDEMKYSVAASVGGTSELVYRRVK
jgi:hypothetical protein